MWHESKERKFCLPLGEQNFLVRSKITGGNFASWHAFCFISSVRIKNWQK